uniref:UDP-glucose ceramide glucosyltransferase-like 1 n=1 Tax=Chelonoidis abingdonii TaxID=106734 RepID=A0A8C0J456_CHEAB
FYKMGIFIALLGIWFSSSLAKADSKAVTTSLTTKWSSTPLLLESHMEVNCLCSGFAGTNYSSYHAMLKAACQNLSPLQQNLLKFSLSLRSYSATIQAFQQIAADEPPPVGCNSFFAVHGKKTCEFDTLEILLQTASERLKPFLFKGDHRFPLSNPDSPVVILYAEIGTEEFSRFHSLLVLKASAGEITYVLRHYVANPSKEKVYLSGYGVELAIKSTEYKAKDDTQVKGENDPLDEVQGFLFGKLRQLYPDLKEELKELRKHLIESTNEMAPLKVWQLQDLSFQTAARILAAPTVDALMVMKDLSQNFPTKYFKGTLGLQSGDSALFINGLHIDLDTQDIFSLFDVLRNEARVMEGLHSLGIEGLSLHNVLKLNIQPSDSDYAVDIRSPAISWINNLEVDSRYNSWPSSVQELLRPTFPGVIRQIRKNFHNFVLIVDPSHESTAELLNVAEMFFSNHIPLRIGLVFVVNDSEDVDGLQDAGVALLRAFNYVAQEVDNNYAFQTLISIYNKVKTGDQLQVEHVVSVLEKQYPYVEMNSILGIDSVYDQNRKVRILGYYEQTGVGPLPIVLFNGMPFQKEQLDPDDLETITMQKILETTSLFQRAVYLGELSSDQDVIEYIMSQPNVVPRINSRILMSDREYLDLTATSKGHFQLNKPDLYKYSFTRIGISQWNAQYDSFVRPVTFWIVGDFDKPSGRQLLYDAIKHQVGGNPTSKNTVITRAIQAALQTQTSNNAKNFITKMAKEETAKALEAGADITEFAVGVSTCDGFYQWWDALLALLMNFLGFYRYVLEPEISFTADDSFAPGPIAKFLDMPQTPLFTLNLNTPESWMVESVRTPYDLDNIYLEEVDNRVAAEYELEYLLLEGHCYDITTGQPPRGLQFTLGTSANPVIVDTIVMANLGYFQLKANPGAWVLRLRKGRSEDIYRIYSHDGTDSPPDASEVTVVLNNFKSKIIKVKVQKKLDMMNEDLLSDGTSENESGFWESLKGFTGGQKNDEVKQDKDDVINIFSVASGHLYERFLRIMMLSVLKHTKTPVKFWFLKNYLSPMFKEFIPYMAEKYNFQYELVQYKWPRWLHQQTEKQRIIWGYKILFLDVLFPLVVDKFLFVDADQIVRTDLKELRDFNLEGAPYGYTPFCESRREMDGYRFWKSGYWASHLAGRKYHISALYVVDLKKFRKIAAGDRLRGQYQGLSQDPNSLSNLDQDLPNNMIHQVPIKSLPQEWLWCETWCDDSSKKRAKTIDLCNNPMTKEPKLQAAVRIVPEWQDYDQEIKQLYSRFQKEKESGTLTTTDGMKLQNRKGKL